MNLRNVCAALMAVPLLAACGKSEIQSADDQIKRVWSEVAAHYRHRADLVPTLVHSVESHAMLERETLLRVSDACRQVDRLPRIADLDRDPQALASYQAVQAELSTALLQLLVLADRYPNLKADASFRDIQAQLEGNDGRIALARNRFVQAVEHYNEALRTFPNNVLAWAFDYAPRPNLKRRAGTDSERLAPGDFGGAARH
ncbi:MAG: LemA family protein [Rhodocyclaceae bacterium]|nr:LemA family protein [Rhodocyclaceae bacterium]